MGKKRLAEIVERQIKSIRNNISEMVESNTTIEDDNYILRVITPTHLELTPINMSVKELHIMCIKRMDVPNYRKFYGKFNIYISEDNKKVVMKV